jgi:hypothetical protein
MRNGKLSRRAILKASTALAAGAIVMQPLDAFAQLSAVQAALIARAKSFELDTPYVPPPGNALEHHASGFAKIMCSAVFVTGLDPDFATENVGYFTAPYEVRGKLGKPVIDRASKAVRITLPNGVTRTAKYLGSQGCVTLPVGQKSVNFMPVSVASRLPDPSTQAWPMGDLLPNDPLPAEIDAGELKQAVDAAFEPPAAMTAAFVVTWRGRLIAERYGSGIAAHTPLEAWSMGKSLTATLMGVLIKQGVYDIWQPAPIPEWQIANDPRAKIRIGDIMHMSSGLRIRAPQDPDYDPSGPYPDHLYLYTGSINSFHFAATRPLQWPPNTVGRYRHRSSLDQLSHSPRRREAWRRIFVVSAACAVRQDRHPHHSDGHRSLRQLSHAGLRPRLRTRLGATRQSLSARRRLERRADSSRGLRQIR